MKKSVHHPIGRGLAAFLTLALILPGPAFALRQNQPETQEQLAGLEETLRSPTPDAASEKVVTRVANVLKGVLPASIPAQPSPAAGLEEARQRTREVLAGIQKLGLLSAKDLAAQGGTALGSADPKFSLQAQPHKNIDVGLFRRDLEENKTKEFIRKVLYDVAAGGVQVIMERSDDESRGILNLPQQDLERILSERAQNAVILLIDPEKLGQTDSGILQSSSAMARWTTSYEVPLLGPIPMAAVRAVFVPKGLRSMVQEEFPSTQVVEVGMRRTQMTVSRRDLGFDGTYRGWADRAVELEIPDFEEGVSEYTQKFLPHESVVLHAVRLYAPSDITSAAGLEELDAETWDYHKAPQGLLGGEATVRIPPMERLVFRPTAIAVLGGEAIKLWVSGKIHLSLRMTSQNVELRQGDDPSTLKSFSYPSPGEPDLLIPIGRSPYVQGIPREQSFVVRDSHNEVSRQHLQLRLAADKSVTVFDQESTAGTYIPTVSLDVVQIAHFKSSVSKEPPSPPAAGLEEVPSFTVGELRQWLGTVLASDKLYGWLKALPDQERASLLKYVANAYTRFGSHMRWVAPYVVRRRAAAVAHEKLDRSMVTNVELRVQRKLNRLIQSLPRTQGVGEEGSVFVPDAPYIVLSDPIDGTANYVRDRSHPRSTLYTSTMSLVYRTSDGEFHPLLTLLVAPESSHRGKPGLWEVAGLGLNGVLVNGELVTAPPHRSVGEMTVSWTLLAGQGKEGYRARTQPYNERYLRAVKQAGFKRVRRYLENSPLSRLPLSVEEPSFSSMHLIGPGVSPWDILPAIHITWALRGGIYEIPSKRPFRLNPALFSSPEPDSPALLFSLFPEAARQVMARIPHAGKEQSQAGLEENVFTPSWEGTRLNWYSAEIAGEDGLASPAWMELLDSKEDRLVVPLANITAGSMVLVQKGLLSDEMIRALKETKGIELKEFLLQEFPEVDPSRENVFVVAVPHDSALERRISTTGGIVINLYGSQPDRRPGSAHELGALINAARVADRRVLEVGGLYRPTDPELRNSVIAIETQL